MDTTSRVRIPSALALWAAVFSTAALAQRARQADIDAVTRLGGLVRPIARNSQGLDVDFHLRGRQLTDKGLAYVARLPNIVALDLRDTKITSAGLVHLKKLHQLRRLHLERTAVDDSGLVHLAGLKNLEYLNLYGTKVTDKGLAHLKGLKNLKRLYVWQTKVTDKGIAMLKSALPKLRVVKGVDLAKLPVKDITAQSTKPVMLKWIKITDDRKPPKSKLGSSTAITFHNKRKETVKVYWVSYGGPLKLYHTLPPGAQKRQNTYSEATWVITREDDTPLGYFITGASEEYIAVIPEKD